MNNTKNAMDALFELNKDFIMSSKFQNVLYKGQKICDYLGQKPRTFKIGSSFTDLLNKMIDKLPSVSYEKLIANRDIYEKYPHLYLRFIGNRNYLVNIGAFCRHLDTYAKSPEIPIDFYLPSFFSRYYTICWLNVADKTQRNERYAVKKNGIPPEAKEIFLHLFYFDQSYEQILESINWADYESLMAELKNAKYNQNKGNES